MSTLGRLFSIGAVCTLVAVNGCGPGSVLLDAGADAAGIDTLPPDADPRDVAPPNDAPSGPRPTIVPVSAAGHDRFFDVTFDAMGNFYAAGVVADGTDAATDFRTVVAKFTPSGALDTTFGTAGFATHNVAVGTSGEVARGVVVQSTGRIVVAAAVEHAGAADPRDRDVALVRFNANGTLDTTFGTAGVVTLDLSTGAVVGSAYVADAVWDLAAYPDDRLVVSASQQRPGGTDSDFAIIRLSADGARDAAFGTNGVATVDINNRDANARTATILPDGSIVGAGYMPDGSVVKPVLFKLTPTGQPDVTFGTNGVFAPTVLMAVTEAYAAVLQGNSFVTAGYGRNGASESIDWLSLRVTAAGVLDPTYGTAGVARIDLANFTDQARSLVLLPGDRVLIVGGGRPTEMNVDAMLAVLTRDGARDATFGTNGVRVLDLGGSSDFFWGAALSPARTHVAIVGTRGVGTGPGNDDGAVLLMPVQ